MWRCYPGKWGCNKTDTALKDATQKFDNSQSTCWWLGPAVYRIGGLMFRLVPYTFTRSQGYKPVWEKGGVRMLNFKEHRLCHTSQRTIPRLLDDLFKNRSQIENIYFVTHWTEIIMNVHKIYWKCRGFLNHRNNIISLANTIKYVMLRYCFKWITRYNHICIEIWKLHLHLLARMRTPNASEARKA